MNVIDFAKINSKNQLRLPDEVMEELGVSKGDGVNFKKKSEEDHVVIEELDP